MRRKHFVAVFIAVCSVYIISLTLPVISFAADAREINVSVDLALERFMKEVKGAKEFLDAAKGVLVLPKVIRGGFFIGGEYGEGALRIKGKTVSYYNIIAASYGLTFGGEQKDIVIIFMQEKALKEFRSSQGWEAGVDGNIALVEVGAGKSLNTTTIKDPIIAFVIGVKGLMVDVSLKGSKFTRIQK